MFRWLSLKVKLIAAFLLLAVIASGVSLYQVRSIDQFDDSFVNLVDKDFRRLGLLEDIRLTAVQIERRTLQQLEKFNAGRPLAVRSYETDVASQRQRIQSDIAAYQRLTDDSSDKGAEDKLIENLLKRADVISQQAIDLIKQQAEGVPPGTLADGEDLLQEEQILLNKDIEQAINQELASIAAENSRIQSTILGLANRTVLLAIGLAATAVLIGFLTALHLVRSINRVKVGAQRLASGDFSRPIPIVSHDEIGQLSEEFNRMAARSKDSYARLAYGRQRDETLLESMSDGLIAINEHGRIVLVNSRAVQILDLPARSDLEGVPIDEVLHLNDQKDKPLPPDYHPARLAFLTTRQVNAVFTHHRQNGKAIAVSINMSPVVVDSKGAGVVMVIRDVTHEREVDRMKTEFISLASHQLRTPLSAIKWFSEMLLSGDAGKLNPDQQEFAQNVADSTERMIQLVNSLLNISRMESGRIIVDPKPTNLKELVTGIVNDLKGKTVERQQTLVVSVNEELPDVMLDPRLIGQVYLNLLTNAIKYTPKGGEISVFVSRKDNNLISQVADNGYGIPKDQQSKIFQKFFRADNVSKVETDGTGLGLYLIKSIVESSGGKIWFESEEGKGTTFWFTLPISGMKAKTGEVTLDS